MMPLIGRPMRNILILGGSGFVGRATCNELIEHAGGGGLTLTVPTRRARNARPIQHLPGVDIVEADVGRDDAALARLVAGRDAVVNLIAILHGDQRRFEQVHVELPRRLARACRDAGVLRLLHVSALGVGADAPSLYLRSKTAGEAVLREAGLALTVLRPSVIFGAEDRFTNLFASLQRLLPLMPLGGANARFQPVWVRDVARAIVQCLIRPEAIGQTYECCGPSVHTLAELVRLAGRHAGHERTVLPLPAALAKLQALAMELMPGEPLMSRDNLRSLQVPNVATGALPGLQALGIEPASIDAVLPTYLGAGRSGSARLNPLRSRGERD
jgi:NADH dehydrogenase